MIAQALRLHETSIVRHIDDYVCKNKLAPESGGSQSYLSKTQTNEIIEYIWRIYGVRFSISCLNKWLHQHSFSYKRPKGAPHKCNEDKQADFIERYIELKSQAVDETISLMDAMHPTQATKVSCGWIKKGHDKAIETTDSRTRLNLIGAIDLNNLARAQVKRYEKVNSETIQAFFTELRAENGTNKRIHLILDGAGYHREKVVKDKADELNIKLHFLPPYSPNLNPIERLWKVMNEHVRNNKYFATAKEFRKKIDGFLVKNFLR